MTFICKDDPGSSTRALFANKAVLAAGSKTLYQLLSDSGDEDVTIIVPGSDFHTFKMLLQYIYTGQVLASILDELQSLILDWVIYWSLEKPVLFYLSRIPVINKKLLFIHIGS